MEIQLENFEIWIRKLFATELKPEICYHNLDHTVSIVKRVGELADHYQLPKRDQIDLFLAGWLHDIGYWDGNPVEHEAQGAEMAGEFLGQFGIDPVRIERIQSAILATKIPQQPKDLFESILCDSDLYHLSKDDWFDQTLLLKKEREKISGKVVELLPFLKLSREFVSNHRYHTDFAQTQLEPQKQINLAKLESMIYQLEYLVHA